jgi:hypothetical protein
VFGPADPADPLKLGWQHLADGTWVIDIPQPLWFEQTGTASRPSVYWIGIQGVGPANGAADTFYWNFVDRNLPTWGDDAAFTSGTFNYGPWWNWGWPTNDPANSPNLYDGLLPSDWWKSADMAFALSGRPVPEPGLISLFAGGFGVLALIRRRR